MAQLLLDTTDKTPLYQQLYEHLRNQIVKGELIAGTRLPASRKMAATYNIARVTVTKAYQQLADEGFVTTRRGAGSYVAEMPLWTPQATAPPALSEWAQRAMTQRALRGREDANVRRGVEIDFGFGRSFPHLFPYDIWRKLLVRYLSTDDTLLARYGSAGGFEPLRVALVDYLHRVRRIDCTAKQVVIVNGVQQAIDIIARLLLNVGDEVLVESPGYTEAYKLLQVYGAHLVKLPVDDDGFPVEHIAPHSRAKLVFVTPANQFPRGGTMPLDRRLHLLRWAERHNAFILEDDYDSELRYDGKQISALQALDKSGRVIYLGTFSKVMFPALRLAYVVLPTQLVPAFLAAKRLLDRGSPTLTQAAIADFISEGHFERHTRQLREVYGQRRQTLVSALNAHFSDQVAFSDVAAGLHVMARFPRGMDEGEVVRVSAEKHNLGIYPAAPYHLESNPPPALILGYTGISETQISTGIHRLAQVLQTPTTML